LDVAEQAFNKKDYNTTLHAAHRVLRMWPLSDYAPDAEYFIARCLEAKGNDEAVSTPNQNIIEKYPRSKPHADVLCGNDEVANVSWRRMVQNLEHPIPLYPSMDQNRRNVRQKCQQRPFTATLLRTRQLRIGTARRKAEKFCRSR